MPNRASSGRRYLNGELVDPPRVGLWSEADLFPHVDFDDFVSAGLFDIDADTEDWEAIEEWLTNTIASEAPLLFLIERCCERAQLLPNEMIETRLKDCSQDWISACLSAIQAIPKGFEGELLSAVSIAVRIDRNRRHTGPAPDTQLRSTLTFFRPG